MAPLWTRLKALVPKEPTPIGVAHRWRYAEVRPYVLESADHISAKEAERRVLILENPGLRGSSQVTSTLYAGLQLIMHCASIIDDARGTVDFGDDSRRESDARSRPC